MNAQHLSLVDSIIDQDKAKADLLNMLNDKTITSTSLGRRPAAKTRDGGTTKVAPLPTGTGVFGDVPNPEVCAECITLRRGRMGVAERVVKHYGTVVRWSVLHNEWMVYTGKHWKLDEKGVLVGAMIRRVIRSVSAVEVDLICDADPDVKEAKTRVDIMEMNGKTASDSDLDAYEKAVVKATKPHNDFADAVESNGWAKEVLNDLRGLLLADDSKWNDHVFLLNLQNGTINLKYRDEKGMPVLFEHDPEDYITMVCAVDYLPEAVSADLDSVAAHFDMSGPGTWKAVSRYLGYCLTGANDAKTYLNFWSDQPNAAKSTILDSLFEAMGGVASTSYAATLDPGEIAASRAESGKPQAFLDAMRGKRLITVPEAQHVHLGSDVVKRWTGGDALNTRTLNSKGGAWYPAGKFVMHGQGPTPFTASDAGMVARFFGLELQALSKENIDTGLKVRLKSQEGMTAVMAAIVKAACDWYDDLKSMDKPDARKALCIPKHAEDSKAEAMVAMNPLTDWIDARCTVGAEAELAAREEFATNIGLSSTAMLCDDYNVWAKRHGLPLTTPRKFGPLLTAAKYGVDEYATKVKWTTIGNGAEVSTGQKWRRGIRLTHRRQWQARMTSCSTT